MRHRRVALAALAFLATTAVLTAAADPPEEEEGPGPAVSPEVEADEANNIVLRAGTGGSVLVQQPGLPPIDLVGLEAALRQYVDDKLALQQQTIDGLIAKVDDLTTQLNDAKGRLTVVEDDVTQAQTDIGSLNSGLATAQGTLGTLAGRLDIAESDIESAEDRIDTAEDEIVAAEGRLDAAEGDIDDAEGRLDTAEDNIDNVESRLTTAEGGIADVKGRLATAETSITTSKNDITGLKLRVTTLEASDVTKLAQDHMNQYQYIGAYDVAAEYTGSGNADWWTISHEGIGFDFSDYNQMREDKFTGKTKNLFVRQCVTYTDSGSNSHRTEIRIVRRDSGAQLRVDSYGTTWSGSGLARHECGGWFDYSVLQQCGYSWSSTCQIQARQPVGTFNIQLREYFIQLATQAVA